MQASGFTDFKGLRALVTGGSGFIGSEVIRQLTDRGIEVRALLRKTSPRQNLEGQKYEVAIGDLSDFEALKRAVDGVDFIFHIAGTVAARSRDEYFRHNAQGTALLAQACAEVNPSLKRFVYVSSLSASGPSLNLDPRVESEPEKPISIYGESKLGGERELLSWASKAGFATTIVRPPAVYGPRDKGIFEFVKFVNSGIIPVLPSVSGSEKYYSVIHVEDLVAGIVLAGLASTQGKHEIFFLSGDGVFTWTEVMNAMAEVLGKKPRKIQLPAFLLTSLATVYSALGYVLNKQFPLTLDKVNELRVDYWICSNERAKQVLGFQPKWNLKDGMHNTVSWYKTNGWV